MLRIKVVASALLSAAASNWLGGAIIASSATAVRGRAGEFPNGLMTRS